MKKIGKRLLLVCLAIALTACAEEERVAQPSAPEAEGAAVIQYITEVDPYQGWALWPDKGKLYEGKHPHGAFLTTYVSSGALPAITGKAGVIPDRAFVVKENYTPEKKLAAVTVMYKLKGYNPSGGDWYWLKYGADGTIEKQGMVEGCIGCHTAVKDNDWLFTGPVK